MHPHLLRSISALSLAAAVCAAHGTEVTLTGWAFGNGNDVKATGYRGAAGAFSGALSGTPGYDTATFGTYCIEIEERFLFGAAPVLDYAMVAGAIYFQARRNNAAIADTLGRLLTYVAADPTVVDTAAESTSMQLAIWNLVYDSDFSVSTVGAFRELTAYAAYANTLLAGALTVSVSGFDVYALEKAGSQDLLLAVARNASVSPTATDVPEPASWALATAALGALALVRRRA